ncbi:putative bifunctional diguanylate cyclase/phosphodiesterase [Falsirhodobacter sp. 20TX0035]|uniref:putative bifunctional diguanylate cyclase/phosphodiesterase n=1 Tax=Falsirhodobacter sp. 20TX0035 TaxID=3022019 RepID=UPI00232C8B86|nr:EAL domain-containing protein [Falsirhodobacter sp. 20TX0035]MDB6455218.1 EAL domain-containing protein [Falsirhodobacter sp. 20TX0035]
MTRVLSVLIAVFIAATIYLSSTVGERQSVVRRVAHHNDSWAISQTAQEFLRLEETLALYSLSAPGISMDDVRLRLDIVISRMTSLREGSLKTFLDQTPARQQTVAAFVALLNDLDRSLEDLDPPQIREILNRMHAQTAPLTNLSSQSVQRSWTLVEENLKALERLHLIYGLVVGVLILCWCGLLVLLLNRNRLLHLAQKQGRDLNESLNAAGNELRDKNRSLEYAAHHDALTALPNRTLFWNELETALKVFSERDLSISLLLLDLDDFKMINDMMGHDFGDMLLHQVSDRMRRFSVKPHMFCRLGGDEFACLLFDRTAEQSLEYARNLAVDIAAPYQLSDRRVEIGCSIGVANVMTPRDADAQLLFKRADIALYRAKASKEDRVCLFEEYMQGEFDDRKALENDLRHAIAQRAFEVAYQVQVDLRTGRAAGLEALARWNHPTRGDIPPDVFIPIAEEIGLIRELGRLILTEACAEAATWRQPLKIAVNLSSLQLQSPDMLNVVQDILQATGLDPTRLELEITESVLLNNREEVFLALNNLRLFGVTVAMDDFGTGYSSLAVLRDIPFDTIKLDKGFVRDIVWDREAEALVRLVNDLGHLLGKKVIIEGVETEDQHDAVRRLGCDLAQGFLFGRPVCKTQLGHLRAGGTPEPETTS